MMSCIVGTRRERNEEKFLLIALLSGIFGIICGEVVQLKRCLRIFSSVNILKGKKKKKRRKTSLTFINA